MLTRCQFVNFSTGREGIAIMIGRPYTDGVGGEVKLILSRKFLGWIGAQQQANLLVGLKFHRILSCATF